MTAAEELRKEILQGLDYYQWWENEADHEEKESLQRWIELEVEDNGYKWLWYNGKLIALGKQVVTNHVHGWLELHVLPKLDAAIPEADTFKAQAERGELMPAEVALELDRLEAEVEHWKSETHRWRNAHASVVSAKRQLSMKYGAIMRRKPAARYRRLKKWIKRCVTKITHKLK